jgi:hypothetical protein
VVWFFVLGDARRSCETRLAGERGGYDLLVTVGGHTQTEHFDNMAQLLAREHELIAAWRAQGWRQGGLAHTGGRKAG